jgi:multiple sugar transport system substrate-binding protein
MAWGNPEQLGVEQEMIDRFNGQNPDLHVRLFRVPGSAYGQKMVLMLASRTAPDVLRVDHYNFPALAAKGYFQDLTEFAKKDTGFREGDFFPTAIDEGKIGDRLYGLNALFGGVIMYYNKTLFKQAGLEDPYELWKRGEWTWERYRQTAKALTRFDAQGKPRVFGTAIPPFPATSVAVWGFGGDLMSPDMKKSEVDSDGTVRAYQFLADLVWKDHVAPTPAQGANSAFAFESGKLGMTFDWMGMTPRFRKVVKSFDWDVCPTPKGTAPRSNVIKGNQLVVSANSRHPEAAWRFIRFLTSEPTETRLCAEIRRAFPTRIGVANSPAFLKTDQAPFNTRAFVQSAEGGRTLPINERWGEWTQIFNSEVDNLLAGRERDARTVLRRAKARIDAALAEDPGF